MERRQPLHLPVSRRTLLGAIVVTPALAVLAAACGDPDSDDASADTTPGTTPGTTPDTTPGSTPGSATYRHSTDADAAVIRLGYEGGFVAPGTIFVNLPTLLVSGRCGGSPKSQTQKIFCVFFCNAGQPRPASLH